MDGEWSASLPVPEDYGTKETWNVAAISAAPEPSTWLLMFAGIGGISLMLRRAKKMTAFRPKDAISANPRRHRAANGLGVILGRFARRC